MKTYYEEETVKALRNFKISGQPVFLPLAKNIALIKICAARANAELGNLDKKVAEAVIKAGQELTAGAFDGQLVTDAIQGGAGTSLNMNVNEVIAGRATEILGGRTKVHALDAVNRGQSTNDVAPSAMKITILELLNALLAALKNYEKELTKKSIAFKNIRKVGRTHLQDAVPITLGQEFAAQAAVIKKDLERLIALKINLATLNLGGTAIGTGLNASPAFVDLTIKYLNQETKLNLTKAADLIAATQYPDDLVAVSANLTVLAANLSKFMNDLRLLASGPRAGLSEISFAPLQKGSTIMPGKTNPIMAEAVNQICFQVAGNHQTIWLAAEAGQLELNTMLPVLVKNLFESLTLLTNGLNQFTKLGLKTITANKKHCQELLGNSLAQAASLAPKLGYDKTAALVAKSLKQNKKLKTI